MKGIILDADSLGRDLDLGPVLDLLDDWQVNDTTRPEDVETDVADADVVLSNKIELPRDLLLKNSSIKLISVMATGVNNVDLTTAAEKNIVVSNAVDYATASVAQHTIALMLNLVTSQPNYFIETQKGRWQKSNVFCRLDHPISELSGKTLGIVGLGTLGRAVANVSMALGMCVIAAESLTGASAQEPDRRIPRVALDTLLASADVISLHCPLTPLTDGLMNPERFGLMKSTAFLINTARGALIDTEALLQAIRSKSIAGAAIDVLVSEPPTSDEPLLREQHQNLLVTPHNAWGAIESRQRLIQQMRENIEAFIKGNPIRQVN